MLMFRRTATARTRLVITVLVGLAAFLVIPAPWELRVLGGWTAAALTFLVWALWTVWSSDAAQTKALAVREDDSRASSSLILLVAATASLVAVGFGLARAGTVQGALQAVLTVLGLLSVALAWAVIHTVYALHYAHLYYNDPEGGIDFPGDEKPDYHDFLYLAFTVGMTYQVSDTDISARPIRRQLLRHALLSFGFGTVIVAFTINVVAGLLK